MGWIEVGLISLQVVSAIVMLVGLISLFLVIIPGLVIIWVPVLAYIIITGVNWINAAFFIFITILLVIGNLIDNLFMGAGAKVSGASWWSLAIAVLAGIGGSIFFPPFGGILAALLGLFIFDLARLRDLRRAWKSTRGFATGCGWAVIVRFIIGLMMIGWWLIWITIEWLGWM
jgi:uncharacterized protein